MNLVEIVADDDECAFDQPCKYGHRVEHHAVYCHNDRWADAPTKCRHSWYYGRDAVANLQDEACPGYAPNPSYKEKA